MDEISVTEKNKKLALSTWDSLDVQGSGFELLGKPIVSRLENQDVKPQADKEPKWLLDVEYLDEIYIKNSDAFTYLRILEKNKTRCKIIKAEKFTIKRDYNAKNIKTDYQQKDENLQSYFTTTEKSKISTENQKYKVISQKANANINLQKREDYNIKGKDKNLKHKVTGKQYKKDDESEITSESHTYTKVIIDVKNKGEKPKIKPRERGDSDFTSESISHHSQKVTVDIKHKEKRNLTKPRRRGDEGEVSSENISNYSRKMINETKGNKAKDQRSQSIAQTSTITGRKGKQEEQKYFSKKIEITPIKGQIEKQKYGSSTQNGYQTHETKYFNKNIVIQPVNARIQKEGTYINQTGMSGISHEKKKLVNTADIIKGVKYFNKNIVIEPVNKGKYNIQNVSTQISGNKYQIQSGKGEVRKVYSRKVERKPWEIDAKNEEDITYGRQSSGSETISEETLKNIPGFNENTKLYYKEITITPVIIPPLKLSQNKQII